MTKIEWTEQTWNPIAGCSLASPGCTNCYAMTMAARIARMNPELEHYRGLTQSSKAGPVWTGKVARAPEHTLTAPLRRRKPTMYFVNSMSDLFHEDVPDEWIDRVFAVMALCRDGASGADPHPREHTFQVLTKRSKRMQSYMTAGGVAARVMDAAELIACGGEKAKSWGPDWTMPWPLPNVWLGVSCEDQRRADERVPDLLATPAAVRFVSAEPLLGPITFRVIEPDANTSINAIDGHTSYMAENYRERSPRLDWIIAGGESGANARPMLPDWPRDIRDQCLSADAGGHPKREGEGADAGGHPKRPAERVAFFFKQWGEWAPGECCGAPPTRTERTARWFANKWIFESITASASREMHADDEPDLYRIGKARAGRLLDGRTWDEYPATLDGPSVAHPQPQRCTDAERAGNRQQQEESP